MWCVIQLELLVPICIMYVTATTVTADLSKVINFFALPGIRTTDHLQGDLDVLVVYLIIKTRSRKHQ